MIHRAFAHTSVILVWFSLLTALSLAPLEVKIRLGTKGQLHNLGHFVVFVITALLLSSFAGNYRQKASYCAVGWYFAVLLEVLEATVYHNRFEWLDLFMDSLGLAAGLVGIIILTLSRRPREMSTGA